MGVFLKLRFLKLTIFIGFMFFNAPKHIGLILLLNCIERLESIKLYLIIF